MLAPRPVPVSEVLARRGPRRCRTGASSGAADQAGGVREAAGGAARPSSRSRVPMPLAPRMVTSALEVSRPPASTYTAPVDRPAFTSRRDAGPCDRTPARPFLGQWVRSPRLGAFGAAPHAGRPLGAGAATVGRWRWLGPATSASRARCARATRRPSASGTGGRGGPPGGTRGRPRPRKPRSLLDPLVVGLEVFVGQRPSSATPSSVRTRNPTAYCAASGRRRDRAAADARLHQRRDVGIGLVHRVVAGLVVDVRAARPLVCAPRARNVARGAGLAGPASPPARGTGRSSGRPGACGDATRGACSDDQDVGLLMAVFLDRAALGGMRQPGPPKL